MNIIIITNTQYEASECLLHCACAHARSRVIGLCVCGHKNELFEQTRQGFLTVNERVVEATIIETCRQSSKATVS